LTNYHNRIDELQYQTIDPGAAMNRAVDYIISLTSKVGDFGGEGSLTMIKQVISRLSMLSTKWFVAGVIITIHDDGVGHSTYAANSGDTIEELLDDKYSGYVYDVIVPLTPAKQIASDIYRLDLNYSYQLSEKLQELIAEYEVDQEDILIQIELVTFASTVDTAISLIGGATFRTKQIAGMASALEVLE
jgi:hypothetical protein